MKIKILMLMMLVLSMMVTAEDVCVGDDISYMPESEYFGKLDLVVDDIVIKSISGDRVINLDRMWLPDGSAQGFVYDSDSVIFKCGSDFSTCTFDADVNIGNIDDAVIRIIIDEDELLYSRFYVMNEMQSCHWRTDVYGREKVLDLEPLCDVGDDIDDVSRIKFSFVQENVVYQEHTLYSIDIDYDNRIINHIMLANETVRVMIDDSLIAEYSAIACVKTNNATTQQVFTDAVEGKIAEIEQKDNKWLVYGFALLFIIMIGVLIFVGYKMYKGDFK